MSQKIRKAIYAFATSYALFACSSNVIQRQEQQSLVQNSGCILSNNSSEKRSQFELGLRKKVRFTNEKEAFDSIIDRMKDNQIPLLSMTIIENGELSWSSLFQNSNFDVSAEPRCDTLFQAASLSKPVVFFAALRMHQENLLDLDRNIQDYLRSFTLPKGKQTVDNPASLRNLFAHTSGITPGGYQGYEKGNDVPSDVDILMGTEGVNTPGIQVINVPNQVIRYSGGGYTLAEVALQDIFDKPFDAIIRQWIFSPLDMNLSTFEPNMVVENSSHIASGFLSNGERVLGGWRIHPEQAAAGLWTTSSEMARFLVELHLAYHGKSKILSQNAIHAILNDEREGSLYGFIVERSENSIALTHFGGNLGYRTGMTIDLVSGDGLVYLINSDNGGALGNELLLSASAIYNWKHFRQTKVTRKEVGSTVLKALAGQYKWNNQIDLSIRYESEVNQIVLTFPNGDDYALIPIDSDIGLELIHPNSGVRVSFESNDNNESFRLYDQQAIKLAQ